MGPVEIAAVKGPAQETEHLLDKNPCLSSFEFLRDRKAPGESENIWGPEASH